VRELPARGTWEYMQDKRVGKSEYGVDIAEMAWKDYCVTRMSPRRSGQGSGLTKKCETICKKVLGM